MSRIVSTSIPYVNANPHIGHALEYIETDAYVRTLKLKGEDVLFITGTDDNALKNVQAAEKAGMQTQAFVDEHAEAFKDLCKQLNIDYSVFVRTSGNAKHTEASQVLWNACLTSGDLYKKSYTGLYCVGCEEFKTEKEIVEGECPLHRGTPLQSVEEENWFFKLANYQERLQKIYENNEILLTPTTRKNEMVAFIKSGLQDFSVSRSIARAKGWGVPVPGDDTQIMYVWFDALVNYLTGAGYPDNTSTWNDAQERTHFVGKDITRFHAVYWPAMLLSAGMRAPTNIFSHGFITSDGKKMSKSLGNVIAPSELLEKYGAEATRYLLLRHVHPTEDTDITWERLDEWYTANLVNGLGNLVSRVMKLAEEHLPEPVESTEIQLEAALLDFVNQFNFMGALDVVWEHVGKGDEFMTFHEPYKKIKVEETKEEAHADITKLVSHIAKIALYLSAFMPETSKLILKAIKENKKPENLFPRLP